MIVEHEAELDSNEMTMLRWMCHCNLKDNKQNTMLRELLRLSACQLRAVDCSGLDMFNK